MNKCSEFQIFVRSDLRFSWGFLLFLSELAARSLAASEVLYQLLLLLAYLIFSLNIWCKFDENLVKIWWKVGPISSVSSTFWNLSSISSRIWCYFVFWERKKFKICKKKRSEIFFRRTSWFFRIWRPNFCEILNFFFEFV